jgi:hypothetical protein
LAEWAASQFWRRIGFNERLHMLEVVVLTILVPLEYSCLGYSRKAELLTESFRAKCDARPKPRRS